MDNYFMSLMLLKNIEIVMHVLPKIINMEILTSYDNICMYVIDRQIAEITIFLMILKKLK